MPCGLLGCRKMCTGHKLELSLGKALGTEQQEGGEKCNTGRLISGGFQPLDRWTLIALQRREHPLPGSGLFCPSILHLYPASRANFSTLMQNEVDDDVNDHTLYTGFYLS